MDIFLYNTASRSKEVFEPLNSGHVGIYTCGPTVYNYAHIGNLRTFLFEDLLTRMFLLNGYETKWVMNITDVGHQTSDGDAGEDKMEKGAREQKLSVWELAKKYENAFLLDLERLGVRRPDVLPRATDHVAEMIELNQRLEEKGYTYTTPEGLYFDTSKNPDYGKLANTNMSEQRQGLRDDLVIDPGKRNAADFILWFSNKPTHIMKWPSPWGTGYPGWHIECSAMSMKYLGETFDVHCGGNDHVQVHHTNEIAQSECATGQPFVRYWMHTAFLVLSSGKMAKSKGGFLTVQTLVDSGYDPLAYRYLALQAHYRSELTLAWEWDDESQTKGRAESLDAARTALTRLYEKIARTTDEPLKSDRAYQSAFDEVLSALNDDLNVPKALATLNTYASPRLWKAFDAVLGLDIELRVVAPEEETAPPEILTLLQARQDARKAKDFAQSDAIRTEIATLGWEVADTPQGATVKRRV